MCPFSLPAVPQQPDDTAQGPRSTMAFLSGQVQVPQFLCHQTLEGIFWKLLLQPQCCPSQWGNEAPPPAPTCTARVAPQQSALLATNKALLTTLVLARLVIRGGQAARPSPGTHRPPARAICFFPSRAHCQEQESQAGSC